MKNKFLVLIPDYGPYDDEEVVVEMEIEGPISAEKVLETLEKESGIKRDRVNWSEVFVWTPKFKIDILHQLTPVKE